MLLRESPKGTSNHTHAGHGNTLESASGRLGISPHQELRQHHRKHRGVLRLDATAFMAWKAQDVVGDPEVLHRQASMLVFGDGAVSRARPAALMAAL